MHQAIGVDPNITQAVDMFTTETYQQWLHEFRDALNALSSGEDEGHERYMATRDAYLRRLPRHVIARCPYCDQLITAPVDHFSLAGYIKILNLPDNYKNLRFTEEFNVCKHADFSQFAIQLHDQPVDTLPDGIPLSFTYFSVPHVIVWYLVARQTSVVVHQLPIGRLDDEQPTHHYSAYVMTYFHSDPSNLHPKMWVAGWGRPATNGVQKDTNIDQWIEAERLFWLNPEDTTYALQRGTPDKFPYRLEPQGILKLELGKISYVNVSTWDGNPPHHEKSFPSNDHL